jgi:hypothetical protein
VLPRGFRVGTGDCPGHREQTEGRERIRRRDHAEDADGRGGDGSRGPGEPGDGSPELRLDRPRRAGRQHTPGTLVELRKSDAARPRTTRNSVQ